MELYPALDVRGGRCVRLAQGDYDVETVYSDDPVTVALKFAEAGARWIHVVDLDAALTGMPVNRDVVGAIAGAVAGRDVLVQSGGGVRSVESALALWDAGVARVVVGTAAVENPTLVGQLAERHAGGVAVGLDTRDGEVAVRGWRTGSGLRIEEVLSHLGDAGAAAVIVTDIGRDGMLVGPDLDGLAAVLAVTELEVIASGGVGSASDLAGLAALTVGDRRLGGAIVGKAIYEGHLTVQEGVAACAASA
jgi:phosphoribosylformimino-5-aminoimidazole carboxamide ribotide isomerase